MIERKRRISRAVFPTPQTKRVVLSHPLFTATFYPNNNRQQTVFCVIVSKKVYKTAVKRNQFKRWVYEVVKQNQKEFDENFKGIIVFSAKKTTNQTSFQSISSEIKLLLNKNSK